MADLAGENCAVFYSNVAQHDGTCWVYSLGSDAGEDPFFDGGVGPHSGSASHADAEKIATTTIAAGKAAAFWIATDGTRTRCNTQRKLTPNGSWSGGSSL